MARRLDRVAIAWLLAMVLSTATNSDAAIIQWQIVDGGNGHYYEFVEGSFTWPVAKAAAESMSYLGMSGHLAVITSAAENDFVFVHFLPPTELDNAAWIGLTDDEAFGGHESRDQPNPAIDGWVWVTGEPVVFTAWNQLSGEPNNGVPNNSGDDDYVVMTYFRGNVWNDQTNFYAPPFIVEYEPPAVPEPSSVILLAGLFGIAAIGQRLRRMR